MIGSFSRKFRRRDFLTSVLSQTGQVGAIRSAIMYHLLMAIARCYFGAVKAKENLAPDCNKVTHTRAFFSGSSTNYKRRASASLDVTTFSACLRFASRPKSHVSGDYWIFDVVTLARISFDAHTRRLLKANGTTFVSPELRTATQSAN
jgi:hypothetical protein